MRFNSSFNGVKPSLEIRSSAPSYALLCAIVGISSFQCEGRQALKLAVLITGGYLTTGTVLPLDLHARTWFFGHEAGERGRRTEMRRLLYCRRSPVIWFEPQDGSREKLDGAGAGGIKNLARRPVPEKPGNHDIRVSDDFHGRHAFSDEPLQSPLPLPRPAAKANPRRPIDRPHRTSHQLAGDEFPSGANVRWPPVSVDPWPRLHAPTDRAIAGLVRGFAWGNNIPVVPVPQHEPSRQAMLARSGASRNAFPSGAELGNEDKRLPKSPRTSEVGKSCAGVYSTVAVGLVSPLAL